MEKLKKGMDLEDSSEENVSFEEKEGEGIESNEADNKDLQTSNLEDFFEETDLGPKPKEKKKKAAREKTAKANLRKSEKTEDPKAKEKPKEEIRQKLEIRASSKKTAPDLSEEIPEDAEKEAVFLSLEEGELAIDLYQTEDQLIVQSAIAGVKPKNLNICLEKDILTIRGKRERPSGNNGDYFYQECFWGAFSREIILPSEVNPNLIKADMKDGVLVIKLPKLTREKIRKVDVKNI